MLYKSLQLHCFFRASMWKGFLLQQCTWWLLLQIALTEGLQGTLDLCRPHALSESRTFYSSVWCVMISELIVGNNGNSQNNNNKEPGTHTLSAHVQYFAPAIPG